MTRGLQLGAALLLASLLATVAVADEVQPTGAAPQGEGATVEAASGLPTSPPGRLGRLSDRVLQLRLGLFGYELHQAGARLDEGFLWERLAERVRLSPRAVEMAALAHTEIVAGIATVTLSYIAVFVAPLILSTTLVTSGPASVPAAFAVTFVVIGGVAGVVIGAWLLHSGDARVFDAVNAYNVDYLDSIRLERSGP